MYLFISFINSKFTLLYVKYGCSQGNMPLTGYLQWIGYFKFQYIFCLSRNHHIVCQCWPYNSQYLSLNSLHSIYVLFPSLDNNYLRASLNAL